MANSTTKPEPVAEVLAPNERGEVAKRTGMTLEDRRAITGFGAALDALKSQGVALTDAAETYGDGFEVLAYDEKRKLINVPFVIMEWRFNSGPDGPFVSMLIVTEKDDKYILNDGGSGICETMKVITADREKRGLPMGGLVVRKGLRVSTYKRKDDKGNVLLNDDGSPKMATTAHLAI